MKRWLLALIPALVIVVLVGYAVGSRIIPEAVQTNLVHETSQEHAGPSLDENLADAIPEAQTYNQPVAAPFAPAPTQANTATAASDNDAVDIGDDPDADEQARRDIARAVRNATLSALDSGEPVHWHKDGLEGDIAVSEAQDEEPNQTCRTVTGTIGIGDDRKQSGDHMWCQSSDGGDWTPR